MSIGGFIRRNLYWTVDFLKGQPVRKHYTDIKLIQENYDLGIVQRKKHLKNLLSHATTHSSFYHNYTSKPLEEFPVVNKRTLLDNYDQLKIDQNFIPEQKGDLQIRNTSGSTGTPFSVPLDTRKLNRRVAEWKYFGEIVGYKSHERLIHLRVWNRWQRKSKMQSFKENIIPFEISQINDNVLSDLCNLINRKKAVSLRSYASTYDSLVNYVQNRNIKLPSLKVLFAISEPLTEFTRERVKKHIGCEIISQYGNEENGLFAQEKIGDKSCFHFNNASYFFEMLKLDSDTPAEYGELARIVVTDLFNYAFPIIRYDTGDVGVIQDRNGEYPVLTELYGRRLDLVFDTQGSIISPITIDRVLKHFSEIYQWQFIQNAEKDYLLLLVEKTGERIDIESIRLELLNYLGKDAALKIEHTDAIPLLSSRKKKTVVNNWKR